ncbi:MAG: flagellar M-ring protein FliF [Candidatus Manganitrophaceae bacterium]|nr:MAG: flagellar M-ring protein FliF [Candidatus Manganitrophaceae bacterium]
MADLLQQMTTASFARKMALLLVLAATFAGGVVLWLWTQKPELQILYTNLSSDDAASVISKLKESHIPYELSADSTAVSVPAERVHELRLQLAGQGLPQGGGVGFEIFDRNTFGTTEFVQKLNYKRALQGELSRTISQLAEVSKARVHLVVPEKTLFSDRQEPSRASVVVTLRAGKRLSEGQIQGIIHLVSSSVEGLSPQTVTVVDSHGQILSRTVDGSATAQMTSTQLDYQQHLEKEIEGKIQSMLERVVGSGKAVVRVTSLLDLRQVEHTEEKFDPDTQVVRSEQRAQEQMNGTSGSAGPSGVPGVLSNVPPGAPAGASAGTASSNNAQKKNEVINYEISKTVSRIIEPIGTIKKLSVAALVDGTYQAAQGDAPRKYIPRNEDEMKKLEELVKKAMGYSAERQDQVEVVNIPFEANALAEEEGVAEPPNKGLAQWLPFAKYGIGLVVGLIAFFFVIRPALKALLTPSPTFPAGTAQLPAGALGELQVGAPRTDQMVQIAKQNPQAATMVVKQWLKEK